MARAYRIRAKSQKRVKIDELWDDFMPEIIAAKRLKDEEIFMT